MRRRPAPGAADRHGTGRAVPAQRPAEVRPGGRAAGAPRGRRAGRVRHPFLVTLGAAGLAALAGLGLFALLVSAPPAPAGPSPGIAVLTGGPDRVERGLALLAEREDARLLISGVGHAVVPADLGAAGARIALGRTATSTRGNAREIAAWAREAGFRDITVVTAGYHMPRALLELRRALPGAAFHPHPVPPHLPRAAALLREYAKLLGAALGLSALVDRPRAPEPTVQETRR